MTDSFAVDVAQSTPDWEGWLSKQGGVVHNWKRRYFIIEGRTVSYYKSQEDYTRRRTPQGAFVCAHVNDGENNMFSVDAKEGRTYFLQAEDEASATSAREAFRSATPAFRMSRLATAPNTSSSGSTTEEDDNSGKGKGVGGFLKRGIKGAKKLTTAAVGDGTLKNPLVPHASSSSNDGVDLKFGSSSCCPSLSRKQRIYGWAACFSFGYALSFMGTSVFLGWDNVAFVICATLARMMALGSALFFHGPSKQCSKMFASERRLTTIVYLGLMVTVLVFAFTSPDDIYLILGLMMLEVCAGVWYSLSFIPMGQKAFKAIFCSCLS